MKRLFLIIICGILLTACAMTTSVKIPDLVQGNDPWYQGAQGAIQERMARKLITKRAKNVILMIADGNSVGTNYATRLYMGQKAGGYGDDYVMAHETFPHLALVKTYNTNAQTPDSAGTATAMNTGVKTKVGIVGLSSKARKGECADVKDALVKSFGEMMHDEGKSVGFVTTTRATHATPAAVYAHSGDRKWEDDSKIPAGCDQKDIATQLYDKLVSGAIDVAMGGGRRHFIPKGTKGEEGKEGKRSDDRNIIAEAKAKGVQYAWNNETFNALQLDGMTPILGLFEGSHMQFEHDRIDEPSIAAMTAAAIAHLSKNEQGYYLMVEAGRVDHANHANNAHRALTDGEAFVKAIAKVVEMTDRQETLIIVTSDHGHAMAFNGYCGRGSRVTGLCYEIDDAGEKHLGKPNLADDGKPYTVIGYLNGPGSVLIKAKDGSIKGERTHLTQAKAVNPAYVQEALIPKYSATHTGEDVAVYARGPWAHLFDGTIEQNYIFHVMNYAVHAN